MKKKSLPMVLTVVLILGCGSPKVSIIDQFPLDEDLKPAQGKLKACFEVGEVWETYNTQEDMARPTTTEGKKEAIQAALMETIKKTGMIECDSSCPWILVDVKLTYTSMKIPGQSSLCLGFILPVPLEFNYDVDGAFVTSTPEGSPIKTYQMSFLQNTRGSIHSGLAKQKEWEREIYRHYTEKMVRIIADDWASYLGYLRKED